MLARVQKWGNSLAIRIPSAFAQECHMHHGSAVELLTDNGQLIIKSKIAKLDLNDLLAQINDDNLHEEIDLGSPIGKESF